MKKVHFIAIGGAVMHNLAMALHDKGFQVTGSDDEINEPSKSRLQKRGLLPEKEGWFPEKITKDLDAVILGMHARKDNPELLRAIETGVKVSSFPEYLYRETADKIRVVIGGSHGKTTITSMVMHVLKETGKDFDYMVGASIKGFDTMVRLTEEATVAVFEGDEYLASPMDPRPKFHLYHPQIALLSGIAWDHINVFPTRENYEEQFVKFIQDMKGGGTLVYCSEDEGLKTMVQKHGSHLALKPYSTPEFSVSGGKAIIKHSSGSWPMNVIGKHNLQNMEGARNVCECLGVDPASFYKAISSFSGAARRLETIGQREDATIFRDFAHSPSKLKATTEAVKGQFPERTLIACMELHTFSSLNPEFLSEYKGSMDAADRAVVFYNPETIARKRMAEITPQQVADAFGGDIEIITDPAAFVSFLQNLEISNANLLLMSSGTFGGSDIQSVSNQLLMK